jgi:hypothetical protein
MCASIYGIHEKSIYDHLQTELDYASIWLKICNTEQVLMEVPRI